MSMTAPVRIAVVGAGRIGYQHIVRIQDEPQATLTAVVDPRPESQELARRLKARWFPDLGSMLHADRPDGVIVATPNPLHVANGLTCVAAGVAMLIEKPVSDDVPSGWKLVEAAEQAGVPMLVGHHRRHSPLIRAAREIVASGRIGQVTTVNGLSWLLKPKEYFETAWRREPGAGVILINLIHVIDDLRNICGDVVSVRALQSNAVRGFPVEDTAALLLRFRNGALGTVSISDTVGAPWSWELTSGEDKAYPHTDECCYLVGGTEGSVSIPRLEVWRHAGDQGWWAPIERQRRVVPEQDPLALQLRQFCKVARREEAPLLSGREAMKTLETTLAVKESAATGNEVRLD
jgi:predicted dehydrogenase